MLIMLTGQGRSEPLRCVLGNTREEGGGGGETPYDIFKFQQVPDCLNIRIYTFTSVIESCRTAFFNGFQLPSNVSA